MGYCNLFAKIGFFLIFFCFFYFMMIFQIVISDIKNAFAEELLPEPSDPPEMFKSMNLLFDAFF